MAGDILLGLDLGSTSFKAVAVSTAGSELASFSVPTPWDREERGTTMSPVAATAAAEAVIRGCLDQLDNARVVSAGVTGMAEAGFLSNDVGVEQTPAYAWFDDRGAVQAHQLSADVTSGRFSGTTGLPVSVRCSAVKIKHAATEGLSLRRLRWESLPEWMARHLTGVQRAELSLAARTGLFDIHASDWSRELLDWVGLESEHMPPVQRAGTPWGTGLPGTPLDGAMITVAGHDHVCAAIGAGGRRDTDVLDSIGTGEAVLCTSGDLDEGATRLAVEAGLTVGVHVVPDRKLLMAGLGTGGRLSTVLRVLGVFTRDALRRLDAELPVSRSSVSPTGWAVEVVRDGTARSPLPERIENPAAVWQAAIEAAGARLDEAIDRIERFSGEHDRVLTTGGWYRSAPFRRLRQSSVRRRLQLPAVTEATGLGAALMGGVAAELFPDPLTVPEPILEEL